MEKSIRRVTNYRGYEENTLAILETFCALDSSHVHDDRLAFLEAVRFSSIVPENGTAPTCKMMEAIFEIMRDAKSLELILASYRLLSELEKRFPRVCLFKEDNKLSLSDKPVELLVGEAWSPFSIGPDVASSDRHTANRRSNELVDAISFQLLLESLCEVAKGTKSSDTKLEFLTKMLLFQYLIDILEGDFLPRNSSFLENLNWTSLRDSLLNKLLGSRRLNYKNLVKDSLFILCNQFHAHYLTNHDTGAAKSSSPTMCDNSDPALAFCLPDAEKCTCKAVQRFLIMMMDLDSSRKKAGMQGLTTRVDGVRTPVIELIMDELSYHKDKISPFLQAFDEPKLKLEIVSQYIQKYNVKPSTRKRKLIDSPDDAAITGFLKCFLSSTSTKGIVRKVGSEAVQVLLAHLLQASMSIPDEHLIEEISGLENDFRSSPLVNICNSIISAFTKLKETDAHLELLPISKEALFTAATVLSTRS
ncbi:negative regulator of systemic acquired resistance SNI1 isoform X1 [Amaranthus tricolor]|uniref:negative regulator of systemic acquired resistance SNI1 isoform X1 n=1 Tax=Amaranthus tricolor TaxID=29722 RepID=UPI00258ECABC|nr:negative regulator of systemic acquired resistance SNI1 isoform X1 [Amaranthus tricolor]XP_057526765.1 negative regulator of systemic acquired resistance SNI1 isoform X1 [Amaranthus tricolor]